MKKLSLNLLVAALALVLVSDDSFARPKRSNASQSDQASDSHDDSDLSDPDGDDLDNLRDLVGSDDGDVAPVAQPAKRKKHKGKSAEQPVMKTDIVNAGPVPTSASTLHKAKVAAQHAGAAVAHDNDKRVQELKVQLEGVLATVQKILGELANSKAGEEHMATLKKDAEHPAIKDDAKIKSAKSSVDGALKTYRNSGESANDAFNAIANSVSKVASDAQQKSDNVAAKAPAAAQQGKTAAAQMAVAHAQVGIEKSAAAAIAPVAD